MSTPIQALQQRVRKWYVVQPLFFDQLQGIKSTNYWRKSCKWSYDDFYCDTTLQVIRYHVLIVQGIILEYERSSGAEESKTIDLLDLDEKYESN